MRQTKIFLAVLAILLLLAACQRRETGGEIFFTAERDGYLAVIDGDREYVPYCVVSNADRSAYLGHMEGDPDDRIYTYKNYPREQWLISFLYSGEMDNSMLLREVNVTDIPEGLESEYDWNP